MKLVEENISIETQNIQQENVFGIGNLGMVFEILRSKMYPNPIDAICREISCNARDANREVGKGDVPVKIVLPSHLDPHFRVMDSGPGISEDRMANVFIMYAASTKRDTNEQTGGFGLGAKTPFSYSDQFMINTVVDGIRYSYSAYIDETKVGKLVLLHKVATDEANGTQIIVPVKAGDFNEFARATEKATRWWDVYPEIVGDTFVSSRPDPKTLVMSGEDWSIYSAGYNNTGSNIIIDGICYDLDLNALSQYRYAGNGGDRFKLVCNGSKKFVLRFSNGALSLAANRETIHWNDETKEKVAKRLIEISTEVSERLQSELDAATTYIAACDVFRKLGKAFDLTGAWEGKGMMWNGVAILTTFRCTSSKRYSAWMLYSLPSGTNTGANDHKALKREKNATYSVSADTLIVVNDAGIVNLSPKRAAQILDMVGGTSITQIQFMPDSSWQELANYHQHLPNMTLSSLIGKKTPKGAKVRRARRLVYTYVNSKWSLSSVEDFENDTRDKVFVLLKRAHDNALYVSSGGRGEYVDMIRKLSSEHKVSTYAFEEAIFESDPDSYSDFTDNAVPLVQYVKDNILDGMPVEEMYASSRIEEYSETMRVTETFEKLAKKVEKNEAFTAYVEMVKKTQQNREAIMAYASVINEMYPELKNVDTGKSMKTINAAYASIMARYPLLEAMCSRSSYLSDTTIPHLAHYINLMDKSL